MLYNLSQRGFAPDIMKFGMNVVMDAINFAAAVMSDENKGTSAPSGKVINLATAAVESTEA